jgi:hypothetical protein
MELLFEMERTVRRGAKIEHPVVWAEKLVRLGRDEMMKRDAVAVARVVAQVLGQHAEVVQWVQKYAVKEANCVEVCLILVRIAQEEQIMHERFMHVFNVRFVRSNTEDF